jgi:hypothetical protein
MSIGGNDLRDRIAGVNATPPYRSLHRPRPSRRRHDLARLNVDADAMLAGMKDVTHYRLTFGGKTFEIAWKNGDEARSKLRQCGAGAG